MTATPGEAAAETILRAAELMRARALAADAEKPGAWWSRDDLSVIVGPDADHIIGMTPAFAKALATSLWLAGDELAHSGGFDDCDEPGSIGVALHLARVYLGEES